MAVTSVPIIPATALTAGIVNLYTVPAGNTLQVRKLTISNPDTLAHWFSIYLTQNGQVAGPTTYLVKQKYVAAGATQEVFAAEGHVLNAGGAVSAVSDAAGMFIQASGVLLV